ncbi:uncharacterized protein MONOS_16325p1 [Monocercomonoides exilis]|uniref:uncharacterized protein n=1 Tax=Monocercomonoides exilis TaxID=2049356 RepID=UPI00355A6E2D|nr:hypothetical protein MONOS_16325p1 [Monocercomonoides exilis]
MESDLPTSGACCGLLSISHCSFSSMTTSSAPFLFAEGVTSVSALYSAFENMTNNQAAYSVHHPFTTPSSHHYTSISHCSFFSVSNVYDGGLFQSVNCPRTSLTSLNNTFSSCNRSSNTDFYGTEESPLSLQRISIPDGGEHSFVWCEWKNASPKENGGAICFGGVNASANISFCLFDNLNDTDPGNRTHGGALYFYKIASVFINASNFSKCSSGHGGAICSCEQWISEQFKYLFFENCSISGSHGMVCYLRPKYLPPSGIFILSNSQFEKNSAGVAAGCIFINEPIPNINLSTLLITENVFLFNTLDGTTIQNNRNGGTGMCFDGLSDQAVRTSFIKFCFFHKNIAKNGMGNDVNINGGVVNNNPFFESFSTTIEKRVWYNGTADGEVYNGWLPVKVMLLTRYVHENGNDMEELCGMNDSIPCRTIGHAFGKVRNDVECRVILLESAFAPSSVLSINRNEVKIIGNGTDKTVIRTSMLSSSLMLFTINTGSLSASSLTIDHNTASETVGILSISGSSGTAHLKHLLITSVKAQPTSFSNLLFDIAFGSISIDSCIVSSLKISTQFIKAPISSFSEISNTRFTEVIRSSGNGGVIECNPTNEESLKLNNISFSGCKCENGNGGCISIIMQPGSKARLGEID